jgi:PAS domain S-box-containing protein
MNVDIFTQQLQFLQGRLTNLYETANTPQQPPIDLLLPTIFKELGTSSEELQVAAEEMLQQTEEMVAIRKQLEAERQRYQDLFEFMPDAYLQTDAQGKILEVNRAAATLFGVEQLSLQGKLLISFIPVEKRPAFRSKLTQLHQYDRVQDHTIDLQPRQGESFNASVTVASVRDSSGKLVTLRWMLRDTTIQQPSQLLLSGHDYDLSQDRPKHIYFKGDIIPLDPDQLWLVRHGLVKLSTMNEQGEEVLVGLAGSSMPFGSSLTDLPTYQAIALTENVDLISFSLAEIAASPKLAQAFLPQITKRLRQTEALLAISGKRQVKERLYHLLLFFKQQFGQKVAQGTRLSMRLTHQELADACCTTRVTITRLLGKLQKQGEIKFDSQNRILFTDIWNEKYLNAG